MRIFIFVSHNCNLLRRSVRWLVGIRFVVDAVAMKYLYHRVIDRLIAVAAVYFDDIVVLYFGCSFVGPLESTRASIGVAEKKRNEIQLDRTMGRERHMAKCKYKKFGIEIFTESVRVFYLNLCV